MQYHSGWVCPECKSKVKEDVECFSMANQLEFPCVICGNSDRNAYYVCDIIKFCFLLPFPSSDQKG